MKYGILFLSVLVAVSLNVNAQTQSPTPQPSPRPDARDPRSNAPTNRDINSKFDRLRALEIIQTEERGLNNPVDQLRETIYRKPSKEEIKILSPSSYLLDKYAAFLRQPDAGITKLNADSSCAENSNVVVAKENCLLYAMPGAGTAFSFRVENYRIPHLADLTLSNDVLKTDGILQQGVMVRLGDVSLENVNLNTKGLKYLLDFKPVNNFDEFLQKDRELSNGVKSDGFLYRLGFYADEGTTFALRSIAYKGEIMRSINGVRYNELDFDKRRDIVVAFRIIEKEANGNITLIWKILSKNNAPSLKIKQVK